MKNARTATDVRPRVFKCETMTGIGQLYLGLLIIALLTPALLPLLCLDGPLSPKGVLGMLGWNFMLFIVYGQHIISIIWPMLKPPGDVRVFSDRVVLGYEPDAVTIPRPEIVSVERWSGPLFDRPWQAADARNKRAGVAFAHNETLGRFRYFVTRESNAVVIRWTGGTPLVVTPDDPDRFVEAVRTG